MPAQVLLVEDSTAYARLVAFLLEEALGDGVMTRHVGTLAAAIESLRDPGADCVLLDLSLPDEHGIEALDRLRAAHPEVPVIVLSGRDVPGLAEELAARGAAAFVAKGDEERLGAAITSALG